MKSIYSVAKFSLHNGSSVNARVCVGNEPQTALQGDKRPRLRWNPQLHALFLSAITALGGPDKAQPRTIQATMHVEGLTLFHVKSHLQKYRRSLRQDADALALRGEPRKRNSQRRSAFQWHPMPPVAQLPVRAPGAAGVDLGGAGPPVCTRGDSCATVASGTGDGLGFTAGGGRQAPAELHALAALQAGAVQLALQKQLEARMEVRRSLPRTEQLRSWPFERYSAPRADTQARLHEAQLAPTGWRRAWRRVASHSRGNRRLCRGYRSPEYVHTW